MEGPPTKRFRGWRLALQKHQLEAGIADPIEQGGEPQGDDHSALASRLLNLWASGRISATSARELAHCAMLDGANHHEIALLASAGTWGRQQSNISNDVHKFLFVLCRAGARSPNASTAAEPQDEFTR